MSHKYFLSFFRDQIRQLQEEYGVTINSLRERAAFRVSIPSNSGIVQVEGALEAAKEVILMAATNNNKSLSLLS